MCFKTISSNLRILSNSDINSGLATNVDEWGKKTLAYPIKKETEGVYILFTFVAKPEFISEFERIITAS